jgi:hypothetical protein
MLVRGFLVGFLWAFFDFFYGLAKFASVYTSCVLRDALRFFNEILLFIKKKKIMFHSLYVHGE